MFLWLVTLTFDLLTPNKWFPGLTVEHFCQVWWSWLRRFLDIVRKNKQTHRQTEVKAVPPRLRTAWVKRCALVTSWFRPVIWCATSDMPTKQTAWSAWGACRAVNVGGRSMERCGNRWHRATADIAMMVQQASWLWPATGRQLSTYPRPPMMTTKHLTDRHCLICRARHE